MIDRYLRAHDRRDTDAALSTFAAYATVVDDGQLYVGADRIREWGWRTRRRSSATRETSPVWTPWTRTRGSSRTGSKADFPGGVVDLGYQFRLAGDAIAELLIAP